MERLHILANRSAACRRDTALVPSLSLTLLTGTGSLLLPALKSPPLLR
jgi:hypothetical protein